MGKLTVEQHDKFKNKLIHKNYHTMPEHHQQGQHSNDMCNHNLEM